jgi:putative ABC transport system permease protein
MRLLHRSLLRSPALSIGVIATLALGVGALTVTFAVVDAALFRQPPFQDAGRITMLYLVRNPIGEPARKERWSFPRFQLLRESQRSFERVASYSNPTLTLSGEDDAELVHGEMVSPGSFPLLRARAVRGRVLAFADDDVANPSPVVVLSHALWSRRFASDPGMVGRAVRINGLMLTVVGVLPEGFHGLSGSADIWTPTTMAPRLTYADYVRTNQNFISVVGRLRRGVSLEGARAELAVLGATINRALPSDPDNPAERVGATAVTINEARVDRTVRRSLAVLFTAVLLLLLLGCANVTNLLLGRAATRRREAAVRLALGSGAGRLFRHLLAEHLVLALPGALLGVAAAWRLTLLVTPPTNAWAARNFYGSLAAFDTPSFGGSELAFGALVALLTALLVAIPPALSAFRLDLQSEIKSGSRGIAGGAITLRRPTVRGVLVAVEASLAVLLVVAAGLLIDSFQRMRRTELGVDTSGILTFWVIPSEARVPPGGAAAWVSRLLEALARAPGVVSATVDGGAPLAGTARSTLYIAGRPAPLPHQAPPVLRHYVAPDHFRTLGIPVRRGRVFGPGDVAGAPRVTVISETAARRFWPDEEPIGKRVWFGGGSSFSSPDSSAEIVGIVGDVMYEPLDRQPNKASFYTPYAQFTYASRMVFLRTAGDPLSLVPGVREALRGVDPDVAMRDVQTLDQVVSGSWARHRFEAIVFGGFGAAALLLAASGIFAVLAYAVADRTREFGVRIALGAGAADVMRLVLREGLAFPTAGMLLGMMASFAATGAMRSSLYEISPLEPRVYAETIGLLLIAAVAACLIPAWRAARADPMEAMRAE